MGCTPFIYTSNTNVSTIANDANIPLGTVVHQMCDSCKLNGDGIICKSREVYEVSVNVTFVIPTASTSSITDGTIQLMQDNVAVPGAMATITSDSATGKNQVSFDAIVRNDTRVSTVLTIKNASSAAISVSNCAIVVKPL